MLLSEEGMSARKIVNARQPIFKPFWRQTTLRRPDEDWQLSKSGVLSELSAVTWRLMKVTWL
jgi:hypothetical protein